MFAGTSYLSPVFPVAYAEPARPSIVAEIPYYVPADWHNLAAHCYVGPVDLPPAIEEELVAATHDMWGRELKVLV